MNHSDLTDRLRSVHTALLCDVLDALGFRESALGPSIGPIAGGTSVIGRAYPLRCEPAERVPDRPYAQLIDAFERFAPGDVVVIETGDQVSAMWGELLSTAARAAGAVGAVMDGLVRDLDDIDELGFPVFGTGVSPLDSAGVRMWSSTAPPSAAATLRSAEAIGSSPTAWGWW